MTTADASDTKSDAVTARRDGTITQAQPSRLGLFRLQDCSMTKCEAEAALREAGAERVGFSDDYDFPTGIAVEVGDRRTAQAWNRNEDRTAEAVERLKLWLAENARAQ